MYLSRLSVSYVRIFCFHNKTVRKAGFRWEQSWYVKLIYDYEKRPEVFYKPRTEPLVNSLVGTAFLVTAVRQRFYILHELFKSTKALLNVSCVLVVNGLRVMVCAMYTMRKFNDIVAWFTSIHLQQTDIFSLCSWSPYHFFRNTNAMHIIITTTIVVNVIKTTNSTIILITILIVIITKSSVIIMNFSFFAFFLKAS